MVVFTCGYCGESVQKPKVEKHYLTKCRNKNPNLSCMDCFKDFLGSDYEAHIKCITEEERYSGAGFIAKEKKGEKKQNAWVEMLQSVLDEQKNTSRNVLKIIETISKHNNTPRKKPKFINFVKNVCGNKTNVNDIDAAWNLISIKLSALSNLNAQNKSENKTKIDSVKENGTSNGEGENGDISNNKKENGEQGDEEKDDNGIVKSNTSEENNIDKKSEPKLSKKQRKEEKKRKKYEAELQSAEAPPDDTHEEVEVSKKDKKKNKNKGEIINKHEDINGSEEMDKNKKRKRQDTVSTTETNGNDVENIENIPVKEKASKKKLRKESERKADESICLHDQNVAKSEGEVTGKNGKFNWHEVIISLLQKKDNELPFKRLQKKVLGEYSEFTGCEVDDRIADKFIKKLKSAPNVRVDKNKVLLLVDE